MATYRLRIPVLKAIQFDGDNADEVAAVIEGTAKGNVVSMPTGAIDKDGQPVTERIDMKKGDWVTRDTVSGKIKINPKGLPEDYDYVP